MEVTVVKIKEILATVSDTPALEMVDIEHYDAPRIRVALSQEVSVGANIQQALRAELRKIARPSLVALATNLRAPYRRIEAVMKQLDPSWDGSLPNHPDYSQTWYGRHCKAIDHPRNRAREIVMHLQSTFDDDQVAFIIGAPSSRTVRELGSITQTTQITLSESPGISAARAASAVKHMLNDLIISAASYTGKLRAVEIGQGVGDGSLRYLRHGLVVSVENDARCLRVASGRVPHIDIFSNGEVQEGNPLMQKPDDLIATYTELGYMPVLMFAEPTTANAAIQRLKACEWRFNWIDIDPLGFAESSEINVTHCLDLADTESIVCITNGGWHAERFGGRTQMVEILTRDCLCPTDRARIEQHDTLIQRLVMVEAAYRALQVLNIGSVLHPLLLYDGRQGSSGVVRSYFLYQRNGKADMGHQYFEYDPKVHLNVIPSRLLIEIERLNGQQPVPSQIPLLRFQELRTTSSTLIDEQLRWLGEVIERRIVYLRLPRAKR